MQEDLIDFSKFLELKFVLTKPRDSSSDYPRAWTVQEHQLEYADIFSGQGFWGLGTYKLKVPFQELKTENASELERTVKSRELYIVSWNWVQNYPPSNCRGKTSFSQWNNTFRYPKLKDIPEVESTFKVRKGLVHLTKGVPDYLFDIRGLKRK
jgi:hypothetical protein